VPGTRLCYTLDGSVPDSATCTPVAGPVNITLTETRTIKAIAIHEGWKASPVAVETFVRRDGLPAPVASPPGGTFQGTQAVALSVPGVPDAVIRYTLDGGIPTETSPVYTGPLVFDRTTTLKAKAWKDNHIPSPVLTETYAAVVPNDFLIAVAPLNTNPPALLENYPEAVRNDPIAAVAVNRQGSLVCLDCAPDTQPYYHLQMAPGVLPEWTVRSKHPFQYRFQIFNTMGAFVYKTKGEVTEDMFRNLPQDSEGFRTLGFRWIPLSSFKATVGTGAYILKATVISHVTQAGTPNAAASRMLTFGYIRPN
jgi:hypothetical protein